LPYCVSKYVSEVVQNQVSGKSHKPPVTSTISPSLIESSGLDTTRSSVFSPSVTSRVDVNPENVGLGKAE